MQLGIVAVGRMKKGPEQELAARYGERMRAIGAPLGLAATATLEFPESRAQTVAARKAEEGARILEAAASRDAVLIALDETGKLCSSQDFAGRIAGWRDDGRKAALFAVGGPDGHDPSVLGRADWVLSLGRMTFPHQIARILVAEQLYRACTILAGHPYHRE